MAGIYFHYPFCTQACNYCNFHFSTQLKNSSRIQQAMNKELYLRKDELNLPIESIYFGGGLHHFNSSFFYETIKSVRDNFKVTSQVEISQRLTR